MTSDSEMLSAPAINGGKVLNSCEVASDDLTTKSHGYCSSDSSSAINVSSLIGSSSLPVPALAWLTIELTGSTRVGRVAGIVAVVGSVGLGFCPAWPDSCCVVVVGVYDVSAAADCEVVDEATINQVCAGVYTSSKLAEVLLATDSVGADCHSEAIVEGSSEAIALAEGSVKVSTCEPLRFGSDTLPIKVAVSSTWLVGVGDGIVSLLLPKNVDDAEGGTKVSDGCILVSDRDTLGSTNVSDAVVLGSKIDGEIEDCSNVDVGVGSETSELELGVESDGSGEGEKTADDEVGTPGSTSEVEEVCSGGGDVKVSLGIGEGSPAGLEVGSGSATG